MLHTHQMLQTHPSPQPQALDDVGACIGALHDCAQACTSCADACLGESDIQMLARCIRLNHDCADLCTATASVLSRPSMAAPEIWASQLQACLIACRACAEECERHAPRHEHCRVCAEACRKCEQACSDVLSTIRQ
ncbi:MAG: four-helix bundle copper-binding protein [Hyphomicrobiaceae bacterium]|nr:four-helix bundle copper-binding protein [Hyphomicrobiaceae bacterium]